MPYAQTQVPPAHALAPTDQPRYPAVSEGGSWSRLRKPLPPPAFGIVTEPLQRIDPADRVEDNEPEPASALEALGIGVEEVPACLFSWPQLTELPPPWASQLPLLVVTLHPAVSSAKQVHSAKNNTGHFKPAGNNPLTGRLQNRVWNN